MALVFSVEEFSIYDGPGIRVSVFLKGCPLRCEWCHNPEGQSMENQIIKSPNGCINCGKCNEDGIIKINKCPNHLLRYCAEEYSPKELVDKISKNFDIADGVTFSGGEPTVHKDFLIECLKMLKGKTHRAVQTCGYCKTDDFKEIIDNADFILYDLKIIDSNLHKKFTGVENFLIIENFKYLAQSKKDFVVRIPIIPEATDTAENVVAIAKLLNENSVKYAELLPYNKFAGGKYSSVGRTFNPSYDENKECNLRLDIFEKFNIKTKVL